MAWDLWSSPYDSWDQWDSPDHQVAPASTYSAESGWECDFSFGCGRDLIEEDAINEKCCMQVLKILITKADTEIDELEKDLVALQSELAWAEHEEWSEICGSALRERIAWLDNCTRNLRSKDENINDVQLLMHREPADNMHDILKALLRNYFPEKDEQTPEVIALNSSSDSSLHATGLLDGHKDLNKSDSHSVVKEEHGEIGITKGERCTSTTLKLQEKKINDPKTIKPANTNNTDSSRDSLRLAADYYDKKKTSSKSNSKSTQQREARGQGLTCEENKTTTMTSNNEKPANTNIMYSSPDSLRLAAGYSEKKKILDSENATQWVAKGQGLAPVEKKTSTVTFNSQQPANNDIMNLSTDSLRLATGYCDKKKTTYSESTLHWETKGQGLAPDENKFKMHLCSTRRRVQNLEVEHVTKETSRTSVSCPDEKNKLKNSDSKIMSEKVGEHTSIPMVDIAGSSRPDKRGTDVDRTVEPADGVVKYFSSDSLKNAKGWSNEPRLIEKAFEEGGKATHQKLEKEPANALVKYMSPNSWRQSAGINKRTECSESRLCAKRRGKNQI